MAFLQNETTADTLTVVPAAANSARVSWYDSAGRETSFQGKQTFMATGTFTPVAAATDIVRITGSATKTIRVLSMQITTTATANGSAQLFLVKRSTPTLAGTFIAATLVPDDSSDAAATATVGHYTANPTAPTVQSSGNIWTKQFAVPAAIPATWAGITGDAVVEMLPWNNNIIIYPLVLRGISQELLINFAGATLLAGQTHAYSVIWLEE